MTIREVYNTWYTDREFAAIQQEFEEKVAQHSRGRNFFGIQDDNNSNKKRKEVDDENVAVVFANHTRKGQIHRHGAISRAQDAVLDIQARQFDFGLIDQYEIARAYSKHSKPAAKVTRERAKILAKHVCKINGKMEKQHGRRAIHDERSL
eukprot:CAMPEP_0116547106 /NCGR_PEP_ID=MMETSP0397-20121206/3596_1 /TAXON_ID=216820 /ORGANISM="Cyclophora tenuis, Strain ECT3854" /LENGTH=149 /DNA_ID=CAMNT_0004071607 /DNA_START=179 /DNA_END=628 /DNA_ORIENTATION=-